MARNPFAFLFAISALITLGLPGYSSHQYSITVRTELADVSQVEAESKRLYSLLQTCVDREIQSTGFLPGQQHQHGNGNGNGNGQHPSNGASNEAVEEWKCRGEVTAPCSRQSTSPRCSSFFTSAA